MAKRFVRTLRSSAVLSMRQLDCTLVATYFRHFLPSLDPFCPFPPSLSAILQFCHPAISAILQFLPLTASLPPARLSECRSARNCPRGTRTRAAARRFSSSAAPLTRDA